MDTIVAYATPAQLEAFLGRAYTLPEDPERILLRASELIAEKTRWASEQLQVLIDNDHSPLYLQSALADATCAQVEFWMEVGEEFDVTNAQGSLSISKLAIANLPPKLSMRAYRFLKRAGLVNPAVGIAT